MLAAVIETTAHIATQCTEEATTLETAKTQSTE